MMLRGFGVFGGQCGGQILLFNSKVDIVKLIKHYHTISVIVTECGLHLNNS